MPAQKRSASDAAIEPRRRSGRISSTPQKSQYFEDPVSSTDEELPPKKRRGRPPKKTVQIEASEDEYAEESDGHGEDVQQVEEDDDDDDDELDEDAPPRVTILPLEKLRDTGGVEYEDHKLHRNTLLFLKDLKANNRRPWLKSHDKEYRRALKDWESFVMATTESIIAVDETIPELPLKDVNFRIHRDIRFSKDPTPYKPHFSAAWSRTGRKGPYACYYVHAEPGAAFVGGGLWCPEKSHVDKLRESIDRRPARWRRVLGDPAFTAAFFPELKKGADAEAAVDAFCKKNAESALKKRPKDYAIDHRDIALLRLRSYTVGTKIDDRLLCEDDAQEKIAGIVRAMSGFVAFLNGIVMPDPGADDEGDESEDDDGARHPTDGSD
ncbi:hypothetical protein S40285_04117 [Stachybotrys chlorohalonatus IBT 40285]|uniref:DUF2461 domain-containing protein n=1 Tax=Stachybotrys chlorohalonatus (strain IBT 40285) TaxID=1283841 RepID=A0A084QI25_STAC4|nr:hypothetical protein S40285_04117 [Stachybotrys chlorohalonata IBT 40285]